MKSIPIASQLSLGLRGARADGNRGVEGSLFANERSSSDGVRRGGGGCECEGGPVRRRGCECEDGFLHPRSPLRSYRTVSGLARIGAHSVRGGGGASTDF